MIPDVVAVGPPIVAAAYFHFAVTLGLAVLSAFLLRRYGRGYFGLWAVAWLVVAVRVGATIGYASTGLVGWLAVERAAVALSVLALLWATLVFAQRLHWRPVFALAGFWPVLWAGAIATAAPGRAIWNGLAVVALLTASWWSAWALRQYGAQVRSQAAHVGAVAFGMWGVRYLVTGLAGLGPEAATPVLYLDMLLALTIAGTVLFLVLEDLEQGLNTLASLSGELQSPAGEGTAETMLRRALSIRGVQGSALWLRNGDDGRFVEGSGVAALWPFEEPPLSAGESARRACQSATPEVVRDEEASQLNTYTAALPIASEGAVTGALVVTGEARDPFTVLDDEFLVAFGQQVGAALANEELHTDLRTRTAELERLQERLIRHHEEERARLWRELHDETAQVLAALNLQLGIIEEASDEPPPALDRAKTLLAEGIEGIRRVTRDLRPRALDDLGLVAAMNALVRDVGGAEGPTIELHTPNDVPAMTPEAETALFRAMQEAISNAIRHADAGRITVDLSAQDGYASLVIADDGPGFPEDALNRLRSRGGLAGIRDRVAASGGRFDIRNPDGRGGEVRVSVPLEAGKPGDE